MWTTLSLGEGESDPKTNQTKQLFFKSCGTSNILFAFLFLRDIPKMDSVCQVTTAKRGQSPFRTKEVLDETTKIFRHRETNVTVYATTCAGVQFKFQEGKFEYKSCKGSELCTPKSSDKSRKYFFPGLPEPQGVRSTSTTLGRNRFQLWTRSKQSKWGGHPFSCASYCILGWQASLRNLMWLTSLNKQSCIFCQVCCRTEISCLSHQVQRCKQINL